MPPQWDERRMEAAHNAHDTSTERGGRSNKSRYTTISIPQPLYHEIKAAIEGTHFRSPTEFLVYVTRLSLQTEIVREQARVRGPPFFTPR